MLDTRLRMDSLVQGNPLTVMDIGARGGVHPRWSRFLTNYTAVLFEPETTEYNRLRQTLPQNYVLLNTALSDSKHDLTLYVCRSGGVTSVYPPNMAVLNSYPKAERYEVVQEFSMPATSLDEELAGSSIQNADFIKIDTQGHELAILQGAQNTLCNVLGLEIEVEFLELYTGQCLFFQVDEFAREQGFELVDLRRSFWRRKSDPSTLAGKGQLAFGDALYFRSPQRVVELDDANADMILRSAIVYCVYGYFSHAQEVLDLGAEVGILPQDLRHRATVFLNHFRKVQMFRSAAPFKALIEFKEGVSRFLHGNGWYSGDIYPGNMYFWS